MAKSKLVSVDEVPKRDVLICPDCGTLFVGSVKGEEWSFWHGTGVFCPVCESLVIEKKEDI